jgi:prepilin-type N-terminal cleavage/methylation domain-containing protein
MRDTRYKNGFTLAELLIALIVTSVILAAVATLAYAVSSANDATDDTSQKQAHVRYATLRISELIRNCRLVFNESSRGLGVWRADDNGDGQINVDEFVYVNKGDSGDCLRFVEFSGASNPALSISDLETTISTFLSSGFNPEYTNLIPECSDVEFVTDVSPPWSRTVSISFNLEENGVTHNYQINSTLRAWAGHLLNQAGSLVSEDDDEEY